MAITVKDIQEKVFPTQASNGYDVVQVDDFLDAIADQLSTLVRENIQLKDQLNKVADELAAKESALKEAAKAPEYDEAGYFKNLQSTMRDTLISAQRTADETLATAKADAERTLASAQDEASRLLGKAQADANAVTERAQSAAAAAKAEYESLKAAADGYRANFRKLVEEQLQVLKANDILFK